MEPGTANSGGWRSPQASEGTPNNSRKPARSGKKKPQPRTVGVSLLVEAAGIEPASASTTLQDTTCLARSLSLAVRYPKGRENVRPASVVFSGSAWSTPKPRACERVPRIWVHKHTPGGG